MLEILKNLNLEVVVKKPETYLDNRFQCTEIADIKSFLLNVTCGVPQGSVVGLYYSLYTLKTL